MTTVEAKRTQDTLVQGALSVARARRLDQPQRWLKLGKKRGLINEESVPSGTMFLVGAALSAKGSSLNEWRARSAKTVTVWCHLAGTMGVLGPQGQH